MSHKILRRLPLAAAALLACVGAQAEYSSPDGSFSMSGFGTLGLARSTTDDAVFNYPGQGGGATRHVSADPDSKVAVQGTYKFTPTVSFTSQLMTKIDADAQYVPNIEWAFVKWQASPALTLRAGRMGVPSFMISDFRDVGYANTTVRPALDVYGQVPVSHFDGADISYQANLGSTTLTSTLWTGDSSADYASSLVKTPTHVEIKRQVGVNLLAELSNGVSVRFGRSQGKLSLSSDTGDQLAKGAALLAAGAAGAGDAASAAAFSQVDATINPKGVDATFTGIGLGYDQDQWVASLEYTKRTTKSFVTDTTGWYGVLGYRINNLTPYVGLSKVKTDRRTANPVSLATAGAYAAFGAVDVYKGLQAGLNSEKHDQRTATLGVRWDAARNIAVKGQIDHISKAADSVGMFLIADPANAGSQSFVNNKRSVNVLSVSLDFVF